MTAVSALLALLAAPETVACRPDLARRVVVLVNEAVPDSLEIGRYYCARRGVPQENICAIRTTTDEVVRRDDFRSQIAQPLQSFLAERPDTIFVVPCWGVPLKIAIESAAEGSFEERSLRSDGACVDRELELLRCGEYERPGWVTNPVWNTDRPITADDRVLIVMRLDGPTPQIARALVDLAIAGEELGVEATSVLDTRGLTGEDGYARYDEELRSLARIFESFGVPFRHDDAPEVLDLATVGEVGHYWGWYTGTLRTEGDFRFVPGAVACHVHSFSAETVRHDRRNWVGPLLAHGATIVVGTVYEPFTSGFPTAPIFWDRFLRGYTVGEALQMSNRLTSWMGVWVGDPLYAPYAEGRAQRQRENRELLRDAFDRVASRLDAGDAAGAQELVARLEALRVALPPEVAFVAREARARAMFPDEPIRGTIAQLRRALEEGDTEAALRISPVNFEANVEEARRTRNARRAVECLRRAWRIEPDDAHVGTMLARRLVEIGRREEALDCARRVGDVGLIGEVLVEMRRYDEAVGHLRQARAARPADRVLALALARALLGARQAGEARAVLDEAVALLPQSEGEVEEYEETLALWSRAAGDARRLLAWRSVRRLRGRAAARLAEQGEAWAQQASEELPEPRRTASQEPAVPRATFPQSAAGTNWYFLGPMVAGLRVPAGGAALDLLPGVYRVVAVREATDRSAAARVATRTVRLDWGDQVEFAPPAPR